MLSSSTGKAYRLLQPGRASTYTYDLAGNRTSTAYPTGVTVNRAHDASNRLTTLKDGSGNTQATYSYDILDRVTGITLANSTTITPSYDLLNRLTSVDNSLGDSVTRNYSYVYDGASRVTSITEPRGTIDTNHYSNRNEQTGIVEPSGSPFADQSFAYDAGYNRSSWTLGTTTTSYTANNLNQYTAVGSASPTWNGDGGLATFGGNTYTYDALGRLTQVSNSLGIYVFSYDPLGRRVKKVDENTSGAVLATYQYHYDGSEVAVEYRSSVTYTYYLGPGIDQPVMRTDGTNQQWYYRDGHGSISAVADNSGNLLEAYEYTVQGHFQITNGSGTVLMTTGIGNDILYTGRSYDPETGNYFYRARYYSPHLGRFISRDPLSGVEFSQGTNLYAYCRNNFLNASDPTGMCILDGTLTAYGYYGPDALTQDLTNGPTDSPGPNSSAPGSGFGFFAFVAGTASTPTEGAIGEGENISLAGWDSNAGFYTESIDAGGVAVGSHADNVAGFGGQFVDSQGNSGQIGIAEVNLGPDSGVVGTGAGAGGFTTTTGESGVFGNVNATSLGGNVSVGGGVSMPSSSVPTLLLNSIIGPMMAP